MYFDKTGHVGDGLYVLGLPWTPAYLLDCSRPAFFEAGFACMGRLYQEQARKIAGARLPDILFLTHVHYDHCGATGYFKKVFPGLKVAASQVAAEIIKRPNAQKLMRELSEAVSSRVGELPSIDKSKLLYGAFEPFEVDIVLKDGDVFRLAENITVEIRAVPGHTRDLLSYYIPERKIIFATESVGNLNCVKEIVTEFLFDYDSYVKSLQLLSELDIEILCLGHQFVLSGKDVKDFFPRSIEAAERFKQDVETLLKEEGSIERVVRRIKASEYDNR